MRRSIIAAGALALAAALLGQTPASAQQRTEIQFWHGLTQPLGGMLEQLAADFNGTQDRYRITATFILKPILRSTRIPLLLFRSSLRYYNYRLVGIRRLRSR